MKNCEQCGNEFLPKYNIKNPRFCQHECQVEFYRLEKLAKKKPIIKNCAFCGKEFEAKRKDELYCTNSCQDKRKHKAQMEKRGEISKQRICESCGKEFNVTRWNGKSKCCNWNCARNLWRKNNPELAKEQQKKDVAKRKNDPIRYAEWKEKARVRNQTPIQKYRHYIQGAKTRNYVFDLTFKQFMQFWQQPCYYCKEEIKTVGIDRLDNTIGYTLENSVPCCFECNKMKMNLDLEVFIAKCKLIAQNNQYATTIF